MSSTSRDIETYARTEYILLGTYAAIFMVEYIFTKASKCRLSVYAKKSLPQNRVGWCAYGEMKEQYKNIIQLSSAHLYPLPTLPMFNVFKR